MNNEHNFPPVQIEWNERHASLLKSFLEELTLHNIRYVILKNDNGLPFENHSKDVDIVIEPGKYRDAAKIIKECYRKHEISYYKVHKFERLRCWYGMNPDTHFAIHIDLLEGFLHKGFEIFPFEALYKHSIKNEYGIQILDELTGNVVLLLHSTICYHSIKEKYVKSISKVFFSQHEEFVLFLRKTLGKATANEMKCLLEAEDYGKIANLGRYFSHKSKLRLFWKHPFRSIYNVTSFLLEKMNRVIFNLEKYNIIISVHAPDGTGKTTFIQHLGNELGFYYVCAANDISAIYHFRPCVLPNLGKIVENVGVAKQDADFTNPHRAKPAGVLSSFCRMAYYWFDYLIGMPLILRKNAQFDKITIFDRYMYDLLVDPLRTRLNLPYRIRETFSRLIKQPKIVFVLDTDVDTIHSRKQELTKEEISRQLIEFRKLSTFGSRFHRLDASKTPEEIANDAIKIVIDKFASKILE